MSEQPKPLRLADALEVRGFLGTNADEAAAELRRLHAIEDEWARLSQDDGKAEREIERLHAVNQELLEALAEYVNADPVDKELNPRKRRARAAIAKAEGGQE